MAKKLVLDRLLSLRLDTEQVISIPENEVWRVEAHEVWGNGTAIRPEMRVNLSAIQLGPNSTVLAGPTKTRFTYSGATEDTVFVVGLVYKLIEE